MTSKLNINWLNKCRCGNRMHTVDTVRGSHVRLFEDDAVKCNSCGREGVIQTCDGIATVLWETDAERAEGEAITKLTREENVQAVFDLKAGYKLGLADVEILKRVARMALSEMDSEPVAWAWHHSKQWHITNDEERVRDLVWDGVKVEPLYRHAQQPVVPDAYVRDERGRMMLNGVCEPKIGFGIGWNACRAAMISADQQSPGSETAAVTGKWIPVSEQKPNCWCLTCRPMVLNDMRFVVCPDCGNKRCPRASDHRNACTRSNEPGQEGSAYPDTPQKEKP